MKFLILVFLLISANSISGERIIEIKGQKKHVSFNPLDPGDPDLVDEKVQSKYLKKQKERNTSVVPFPIKTPQTYFERGILKAGTRVCLVGDTGNGSKRQKLISNIMAKSCDQIRHLGDIIYYIGVKDINDPRLKERFLDIYQNIRAPMYLTVGNHDYYLNPDVWLEVSKRFPKYIFPNHYYMEFFSHQKSSGKGICFLSLDSTPFQDYDPKIGMKAPRIQKQLQWLDASVNRIKNRCSFTMAFFHHPYLLPQKGRTKKNEPLFLNELMRKRLLKYVDFFVTGHDHYLAYYPFLPKNPLSNDTKNVYKIPQIVSGSGGQLQTEAAIEQRPFGQVFRDSGFVQMTLLNNSDHPKFNANFKFINHMGKILTQFNYSK